MSDLIAALTPSAAIYPLKYEPVANSVLLVGMSAASYRAASFLDDRIVTPALRGSWISHAKVAERLGDFRSGKSLHFIFHAGHVGSTLVSRLLDDAAKVLGLREPLPLRVFAEMMDCLTAPESLLSAAQFETVLASFLTMWSRGFEETDAVVVKATSSVGRLAPCLMQARPESRAVYLNLPEEPYLAALLAGANSAMDLRGHGPERIRRLTRILGSHPLRMHTLSLGELAAMSWLAERLTQDIACRELGSRVLSLDFERVLADIREAMERILVHFGLEPRPGTLDAIARSPMLGRYSKAPGEYAYSPEMRAQLLNQARREHALEIGKGLALLKNLAGSHQIVAGTLKS